MTNAFAQDSTKTKWNSSLTLASRNVFRGVDYGGSPSIMMSASWAPCKYAEIGTYGNVTLNGNKGGYGNQVNLYFGIKPFAKSTGALKNISVTADDYFYFNSNDASNNYLDWSHDSTNHFIEGRIKYEGQLSVTVGSVLYSNKADSTKGVYMEGNLKVNDSFSLFVGYITGSSNLNFQGSSGVTNIGGTVSRKLSVKNCCTELKTSLIFSPNYKNHMVTSNNQPNGVGSNPVNLVVSLTF